MTHTKVFGHTCVLPQVTKRFDFGRLRMLPPSIDLGRSSVKSLLNTVSEDCEEELLLILPVAHVRFGGVLSVVQL